ncbi:hypothetical protein B0H13DRAFT_1859330 [Mycena leptocephala]|nr:hypothetical protein B0H13DRAFT_1859330 [Mycena leptocephala]
MNTKTAIHSATIQTKDHAVHMKLDKVVAVLDRGVSIACRGEKPLTDGTRSEPSQLQTNSPCLHREYGRSAECRGIRLGPKLHRKTTGSDDEEVIQPRKKDEWNMATDQRVGLSASARIGFKGQRKAVKCEDQRGYGELSRRLIDVSNRHREWVDLAGHFVSIPALRRPVIHRNMKIEEVVIRQTVEGKIEEGRGERDGPLAWVER